MNVPHTMHVTFVARSSPARRLRSARKCDIVSRFEQRVVLRVVSQCRTAMHREGFKSASGCPFCLLNCVNIASPIFSQVPVTTPFWQKCATATWNGRRLLATPVQFSQDEVVATAPQDRRCGLPPSGFIAGVECSRRMPVKGLYQTQTAKP